MTGSTSMVGQSHRASGPSLLVGAILLLAIASCGIPEASGHADEAVQRFHAQFEADEWSAMYADADPQFRAATSLTEWTALMSAVKRKLGPLRSTSRTNVNVSSATSGTTVTQAFDTSFEHGRATEQFRWKIVGGRAVLLAYNINSPTLITR